MMPSSPEVMRVIHDNQISSQRPHILEGRDRPMRRRKRQPDPLGVRMARMPVDEMVDSLRQRMNRVRGLLRETIAPLARRIPAGRFPIGTSDK